jgi:hypothetical protein
MRPLRVRALAALGLALVVLAGCAADPRYKEGLSWVLYNEAEKARLQAQGFPQYVFH